MALNITLLHDYVVSTINQSRSRTAVVHAPSIPPLDTYSAWLQLVAEETEALATIPAIAKIQKFKAFLGIDGGLDHNSNFITDFTSPGALAETIFKNMAIFYKVTFHSVFFDMLMPPIIARHIGTVLRLPILQVLFPVFELLRNTLRARSLPSLSPLKEGLWVTPIWSNNMESTVFLPMF